MAEEKIEVSRFGYCARCGKEHTSLATPLTCTSCGTVVYCNAKPVSVLLVRVKNEKILGPPGVLLVRRGGNPEDSAYGKWALPGGYQMAESEQEAAARETREEVNIDVSPVGLEWLTTEYTKKGNIQLHFWKLPRIVQSTELAAFRKNDEVHSVGVCYRVSDLHDYPIAYPTHEQVIRDYFAQQQ